VTGPVLAVPLPPADPDRARLDAVRRLPEGPARRAAAVELEAVFLTELLSAMRKTVPEDDFLPRSPARSIYEGTFDHAVAQALAARDPLGLVETFGRGLKEPSRPADK
jgi:Rod binding domain-containing protein